MKREMHQRDASHDSLSGGRESQNFIHPNVFFIHPGVSFYCPGSLLAVQQKQTPG